MCITGSNNCVGSGVVIKIVVVVSGDVDVAHFLQIVLSHIPFVFRFSIPQITCTFTWHCGHLYATGSCIFIAHNFMLAHQLPGGRLSSGSGDIDASTASTASGELLPIVHLSNGLVAVLTISDGRDSNSLTGISGSLAVTPVICTLLALINPPKSKSQWM